MKKFILITAVFASCAILIPGLSIASDYPSDSNGYQDTTIASVTSDRVNPEEQSFASKGYQDTTTNNIAGGADPKNYISNAHTFCTSTKKDCPNVWGRFRRGLSYSGSSCSLPQGAICLIYSDNFNWVVSDIRIDPVPLIVGVSNCKPVELIRCYDANYYHVLGTSLVMSTSRAS
jgi:hypothetical protein